MNGPVGAFGPSTLMKIMWVGGSAMDSSYLPVVVVLAFEVLDGPDPWTSACLSFFFRCCSGALTVQFSWFGFGCSERGWQGREKKVGQWGKLFTANRPFPLICHKVPPRVRFFPFNLAPARCLQCAEGGRGRDRGRKTTLSEPSGYRLGRRRQRGLFWASSYQLQISPTVHTHTQPSIEISSFLTILRCADIFGFAFFSNRKFWSFKSSHSP